MIDGEIYMSAEEAERLAKPLPVVEAQFWMRMQDYDRTNGAPWIDIPGRGLVPLSNFDTNDRRKILAAAKRGVVQ